MVNFFRDYVLSSWQIGLLKLTLFVAGLVVGAVFSGSLQPYLGFLGMVLSLGVLYWLGWSIKNLSS